MITIRPTNKDYYTGFVIEGHAEYAPHGQDIVCAGVTASFYTTVFTLRSVAGGIETVANPGYSSLRINVGSEFSDAVIDGFLHSVGLIQKEYPGTISIEGDSNHEQRI